MPLLGKDRVPTLFRNKILLLTIVIAAATTVLAILVQPLFILILGIRMPHVPTPRARAHACSTNDNERKGFFGKLYPPNVWEQFLVLRKSYT
jgi:hypothetical protein